MPNDLSSGLAATFAEISRSLWSAPTVPETLQRIVELAPETVSGCDRAAISLIRDGAAITAAWTDPVVWSIDHSQHVAGEGPSLDAIAGPKVIAADDLSADDRWPAFSHRAIEAGMACLVSYPLVSSETRGAMNLYAKLPGGLDATDRATGTIFAAHAGVALGAAESLEHAIGALEVSTKRLDDLHGALASREVIGQAEGVLMHRALITGEQAFGLLRRASQNLNIPLRNVAQTVVDTGDLPQ